MSAIVECGGGAAKEEKTVTAGTGIIEVLPDTGKLLSKVVVNPTPSQSKTVSPSTSQQTVSPDAGKLLSQVIVNAMASGALSGITVSSAGLITAQVGTSGYLASGTKITKQLTKQAAKTWTPTTKDQSIASGRYLTGKQTIKGDANLLAANIKSGVSIFGVTGNFPAIELAEMGFTKFSIDSFIFSSRKVWRDAVIPHSLGENPKLVYIYAESEITTANDIDSVIGVLPKKQFDANPTKIQLNFGYLSNASTGSMTWSNSAATAGTYQDGSLLLSGSAYQYYAAGVTYKLITFA